MGVLWCLLFGPEGVSGKSVANIRARRRHKHRFSKCSWWHCHPVYMHGSQVFQFFIMRYMMQTIFIPISVKNWPCLILSTCNIISGLALLLITVLTIYCCLKPICLVFKFLHILFENLHYCKDDAFDIVCQVIVFLSSKIKYSAFLSYLYKYCFRT